MGTGDPSWATSTVRGLPLTDVASPTFVQTGGAVLVAAVLDVDPDITDPVDSDF